MKSLQEGDNESWRCWPLTLLTPQLHMTDDPSDLWGRSIIQQSDINHAHFIHYPPIIQRWVQWVHVKRWYIVYTRGITTYDNYQFFHNSHPVWLKISWQILWGCHFREAPRICFIMLQMGQNHKVVDSCVLKVARTHYCIEKIGWWTHKMEEI